MPATPAAIRTALRTCNPICHPSVMMRKEAVLAAGGYRRAFAGCEDFDLWVRMSERHDLVNLQEPLLRYREHDQQATWENLEQRLCAEVGIFASARARADGREPPLRDEPVSLKVLASFGMTEVALRRELRLRAMDAAMHAINGGQHAQAMAALKIASRHGAAVSEDALAYWKLRAKAALLALRA